MKRRLIVLHAGQPRITRLLLKRGVSEQAYPLWAAYEIKLQALLEDIYYEPLN